MKCLTMIAVFTVLITYADVPLSNKTIDFGILGFVFERKPEETTNMVANCYVCLQNRTSETVPVYYARFKCYARISWPDFYVDDGSYISDDGSLVEKKRSVASRSALFVTPYSRCCGRVIDSDKETEARPMAKPPKKADMAILPTESKVLKIRFPIKVCVDDEYNLFNEDQKKANPDEIESIFLAIYNKDHAIDNKNHEKIFEEYIDRYSWTIKTNAQKRVYIAVDKDFSVEKPCDGILDYLKQCN